MNRLAPVCAVFAACGAIAAPAGAQGPHPNAAAALTEAKQATAQPPAGEAGAEPTLALVRLSQALPRLEGKDRRIANRILARPDDGIHDRYGDGYTAAEAAESPACDTHFCVHWVDTSKDKPSLVGGEIDGVPDYVDEVLATADQSFAKENTDLGWTDPVGDGPRGGGGTDRTDVYLLELDGAYFGYSSPDEGQRGRADKQAYLVIDNDYEEFTTPHLTATEALQVTFAHEYNHVLQFAYDSLEDLWMFEATATWMENEVYPGIDDYLNYIPAFARSSRVPLTGNDGQGLKIYGSAVWNHYLAETDDPAVVRDAWDDSDSLTDFRHLSVAAYDSALGGTGNPFATLGDKFIDFASATAEWRSRPDAFPDADRQPDMKRSGKLVRGRARTIELDHLAYALLKVPARLAHHDLNLRVRAPDGTRSGIDLIGRRGPAASGNLESSPVHLDAGGNRTAALAGDDYARVTAVIVNADGRVNNQGNYTRDGQSYRVKLVRAN